MSLLLALSLLLPWVQVRSDTFVVKSSAGEESAKLVLNQLEEFHQMLGTMVFQKVELPELPVDVLVIGDQAQMKELAPEYAGRKLGVAGYYQRGKDRDFIVLSGPAVRDSLTGIVYHELTHYFLSRSLADRPAWLSEGLAEYFSTAEITKSTISLGSVSRERLQVIRNSPRLGIEELFRIDRNSPYYNEQTKASVFYAQSWAFVHFMMHGRHSAAFKQYIDALRKGPADLFAYLKAKPRDVEAEFRGYLTSIIQKTSRISIKASTARRPVKAEPIPEAEAQMSISEIFLASGRLAEAARHLQALADLDIELPRASYYRGVLAQISGSGEARDLFVGGLTDPQLASRAAVSLVQLGDLQIPAVRAELELAASSGTRNPDVYWALAEIHLDDVRRIEEAVGLTAQRNRLENLRVPVAASAPIPDPVRTRYGEGGGLNVRYQLFAESQPAPQVQTMVEPYYPDELRQDRVSGQVVLDLQVTGTGQVNGVWLVSAAPDVFGGLGTEAVRQWKFEPMAARIRVVLEFTP